MKISAFLTAAGNRAAQFGRATLQVLYAPAKLLKRIFYVFFIVPEQLDHVRLELLDTQRKLQVLTFRNEKLEAIFKEAFEVNVDAAFHRDGQNHVIVFGRFKGRDYVNSYTLSGGDFDAVLRHLQELTRYTKVRRMDAPPVFRATWERINPDRDL